MRMVFGLVLVAGVALAGGAVYMAKNYIGQYQAALAAERAQREKIVPTVPVFVADRQLKYGEALTAEDVRTVDWPETSIPEGAFTEDNPLFPEGVTDSRVVLRIVEKDEAILAVKVTEPGEEAGITSRLERGIAHSPLKWTSRPVCPASYAPATASTSTGQGGWINRWRNRVAR